MPKRRHLRIPIEGGRGKNLPQVRLGSYEFKKRAFQGLICAIRTISLLH